MPIVDAIRTASLTWRLLFWSSRIQLFTLNGWYKSYDDQLISFRNAYYQLFYMIQARDVLYRVIRIQCCNRFRPGERTPTSCQMSYELQVGISVPESLSSKASEREINRLESEFNAWGGQDMVTAHLDEYYDDPTITFPMLTHLQPNKTVHIDSLPLHSVAFLAYIGGSSGYLDLLMENDIARRVILSFVLAVTDKYRRGKTIFFLLLITMMRKDLFASQSRRYLR